MKLLRKTNQIVIEGENYSLKYDQRKPMYIDLQFSHGIGCELFIPSGCDCDEKIDEIIQLAQPKIAETTDMIQVVFEGETTLWERVEYIFECGRDRVSYFYKVFGNGSLDNARFFEGFLKDDPRLAEAFYPYFCGPGRHKSYHRTVKEFMHSSAPRFDLLYSFGINSSDKREFAYYEDARLRINCDRYYEGGDWLVTPPPFLYMMGNRDRQNWVTMGLAVPAGQAQFLSYEYSGGEGFGLNLTYDGETRIKNVWKSPSIVFLAGGPDVYEMLDKYVDHLSRVGMLPENDRSEIPLWWRKPIFGGWGEQVFHSNRWDCYFSGKYDDWEEDNVDKLCTQAAYETMLATLEKKGIDPTILIVDNRWFSLTSHLEVDEELWPDMKGFITAQHAKGRKVILWVSPWSYCRSAWGKDVPLSEQMILDDSKAFTLELDTDVFYPACKREHRKTRRKLELPEATLAEPHWKFFVDPLNQDYVQRLSDNIQYLLSPEGLDADGFEFDYTHFLPQHRGIEPVTPRTQQAWGVELLHSLISIYYHSAKNAKSDALIISHTFNPYFNDVVDMLRLQDIYTDRRSIVPQMDHRAQIAKRACPGCMIHTDQHPMPSLEAWREYAAYQSKIGNPCLYYVTGIETTRERFTEQDYELLRQTWTRYNAELDEKYRETSNVSKKKT